jgi:hypothetical protein
MKKNVFALLLAVFLFGPAFPAPAFADDRPAVMIILDASGSMWGRAGNETKIEAARKVLSKVVPALPPTLDVGLTAFGHRRTGDCNDIEILVPLGSKNRNELLQKALGIQPKGRTPLALSVELIADTLKERDADTTIIMVSDGKDTCSPDPCAAVKKLKESGVRFILHVVGFGVNDEEHEQLQCMAKAGGGSYYTAKDAESLLAAFVEMTKTIDESIKLTPPETKAVTRTSALAKLRVAMPESAVKSLQHYMIVGKDGKPIKTVDKPKADMTHALPSGEYHIVMGYANPNYKPPTEVTAFSLMVEGESTALFGALLFNIAGKLGESVRNVTLRDGDGGSFSLTNEYHGNGYYLFTSKPLPGGVYDVEFAFARNESKPVLFAGAVLVEAGKESVLEIDSGIVMKKPQERVEGWDIVPSGTDTALFEIRRRSDNDEPLWRHFPVPAGKYDILFHVKGMDIPLLIGEGVEIGKGEIVSFDSGM